MYEPSDCICLTYTDNNLLWIRATPSLGRSMTLQQMALFYSLYQISVVRCRIGKRLYYIIGKCLSFIYKRTYEFIVGWQNGDTIHIEYCKLIMSFHMFRHVETGQHSMKRKSSIVSPGKRVSYCDKNCYFCIQTVEWPTSLICLCPWKSTHLDVTWRIFPENSVKILLLFFHWSHSPMDTGGDNTLWLERLMR